MKLHVPDIGESLTLSKDWSFSLMGEYRNLGFLEEVDQLKASLPTDTRRYRSLVHDTPIPVTLPKGASLTVDRIYIRKGAAEFSSLTFLLPVTPQIKKHFDYTGTKKSFRFWVKLTDANNIEFSMSAVRPPEIRNRYRCAVVFHDNPAWTALNPHRVRNGFSDRQHERWYDTETTSPEKAKKSLMAKVRQDFGQRQYSHETCTSRAHSCKEVFYYNKAEVRLSLADPSLSDYTLER